MASSRRIDERWIGAIVLAPALLDIYRYFNPDARWATWTSRGVKMGSVAAGDEVDRAEASQPESATSYALGPERERHRAFDDDLAVDSGIAGEHAHAAAQPLHDHLNHDHMPG